MRRASLPPDPESTATNHSSGNGLLNSLGPGLITGASDDDPSGIATYSQAGAQFGYGLSWVLLFSWPLMAAAQMVSARIGRVTGVGIAGALRHHGYGVTLRVMVGLLLIANIINLGADLSAMADATRLLLPLPQWLLVLAFGVFCIWMQVFLPYARTVRILKWLTLSLFAYFATVMVVDVDWRQVARDLVMPDIKLDRDYLTTIVAVLGTTISPYLFFWQAAEEAEDVRAYPQRKNLLHAPEQADVALARIRMDTLIGMGISNLVALAIVITTAATLNANGVTTVQTSAQAAEALRPIAGQFAFTIFALGIIGTGLLAVPVLAGSAAYAVGEAFHWRTGLSRQPSKARAFYATIAIATALGMALSFAPIDPMSALFWAAVVNGVIAVPIMVVMMMAASNATIMGDYAIKGRLRFAGWLSTTVMAIASLAMFAMML